MRRCFYHTDLGQNAVFHNFVNTNCNHSIFRTIEARVSESEAFSETVKITYTASRFSLLTSAKVDCLN